MNKDVTIQYVLMTVVIVTVVSKVLILLSSIPLSSILLVFIWPKPIFHLK